MNDSATGGYLLPAQTTPLEEDLALDTQLAGIVGALCGIDPPWAVPMWQPAPEAGATQTWCEVGITAQGADANPSMTHDSAGTGSDRYRRDLLCTVTCVFHGPAAKQHAQVLADGVWVPQNREFMGQFDLACRGASEIRAVPARTGSSWERRYELTLTLARSITRTYPVRNLVDAVFTVHTDIAETASR